MKKPLPFHSDVPNEASARLPTSLTPSASVASAPKSDTPRANIVYASPPSLLNKAQARGEKLGSGFATLSAADFERADSFVSVVERAQLNARAEDAHACAVAEDPEALRDMGFWGVDKEDW
jgi:hypothetical protein